MSKSSFFRLLFICTAVALTSCSSKPTQTEKQTEQRTEIITEKTTEVITEAETVSASDYADHVMKEVNKNGLHLVYPDVAEWSIFSLDGLMSVSVTATKENEKCIVTAWIETDNTVIHYLDTKYGVIIDDGTIED